MTSLNPLGQAVLASIDAYINATHARGDRDSIQSAIDMADVRRRASAIIGNFPPMRDTPQPLQQSQGQPQLSGLDRVPVRQQPSPPKPEPRLPRADLPPALAGSPAKGWGG